MSHRIDTVEGAKAFVRDWVSYEGKRDTGMFRIGPAGNAKRFLRASEDAESNARASASLGAKDAAKEATDAAVFLAQAAHEAEARCEKGSVQ